MLQATELAYSTLTALVRSLGEAAPTDSGSQQDLERLLRAASRAIDRHCNRSFLRESLTETVMGDGSPHLLLSRTPIVQLSSIVFQSSPLIGATIEDADAGLLYYAPGFGDTRGYGLHLTQHAQPDWDTRDYSVTYVGGYLLPPQNMVSRTLSVSAAQSAYLDSAGLFPLLVPGDLVLAAGFTTPANNGLKIVVSRTASVLVVNATLVDEGAPAASADPRQLDVSTLPSEVEQACLETAKAWWVARDRDPAARSVSVGDLSVTYEGGATPGAMPQAMPFGALALLAPWARVV